MHTSQLAANEEIQDSIISSKDHVIGVLEWTSGFSTGIKIACDPPYSPDLTYSDCFRNQKNRRVGKDFLLAWFVETEQFFSQEVIE